MKHVIDSLALKTKNLNDPESSDCREIVVQKDRQ